MALIPPPAFIPDLVLSFKTKGQARMNDSLEDAKTSDFEFKEKRPDVLRRDKYTCMCCGIVAHPSADAKESGGGLEVHHLSGDHHDNRYENLISLCPICHAVLHFWFSATKGRYRKAMVIVYLPWISQGNLNLLSWGTSIVRYRCEQISREHGLPAMDAKALAIGGNAEGLVDAILECGKIPGDFFPDELGRKRKEILDVLGNAANLAMALREIARGHPEAFSEREQMLYGLRVFFHPDHLKDLAIKFSAMPAWLPGLGSKWAETWQAASDGRRV